MSDSSSSTHVPAPAKTGAHSMAPPIPDPFQAQPTAPAKADLTEEEIAKIQAMLESLMPRIDQAVRATVRSQSTALHPRHTDALAGEAIPISAEDAEMQSRGEVNNLSELLQTVARLQLRLQGDHSVKTSFMKSAALAVGHTNLARANEVVDRWSSVRKLEQGYGTLATRGSLGNQQEGVAACDVEDAGDVCHLGLKDRDKLRSKLDGAFILAKVAWDAAIEKVGFKLLMKDENEAIKVICKVLGTIPVLGKAASVALTVADKVNHVDATGPINADREQLVSAFQSRSLLWYEGCTAQVSQLDDYQLQIALSLVRKWDQAYFESEINKALAVLAREVESVGKVDNQYWPTEATLVVMITAPGGNKPARCKAHVDHTRTDDGWGGGEMKVTIDHQHLQFVDWVSDDYKEAALARQISVYGNMQTVAASTFRGEGSERVRQWAEAVSKP
jgi:hypothetical protein